MKIALINENSQAAKNAVIEKALKNVVEPMGHEVVNYGMYTAEDANQLTYVQIGILAAVLLNSKACDLVITGCGTGEGAMLACNSFPGVICGHVEDALDALEADHDYLTAGGVFPEHLIKNFIALKRKECLEMSKIPHPAEFDKYFNM